MRRAALAAVGVVVAACALAALAGIAAYTTALVVRGAIR